MFSFFKRNKTDKLRIFDFFNQTIVTDIHSHLLPGIDDGSPDMETSLMLIGEFQELGFQKLITTPHIRMEVYPNTPNIIKGKLSEVQSQINGIQIDASAEYYIDDNYTQLLEEDHLISLAGSKYLLAEYPMIAPLLNYEERIFEMTKRGYTPVIAHPERYRYWHQNPEVFERLKNLGCLLQLNILAVEGYYGADIKKIALHLLKNNLYDLIGTDVHHDRHIQRIKKLSGMSKEMNLLENYSFQNKALFGI
ncbi:tyrosine-protein phosphatase [Flectobacillus roseus]|uniref:protein-tyrosine-phosphatase n=1 Tax=Flectobacillus roseus TaxID=502259 RepID=A0ABT6YF21_9BACT|nr:CpsB/CapC family capsule biosynthesis tyrosine phosphatase [Flectobacillus roseus]MDI9862192.1 histidinol phosphatase [Flectobacillus roseus]